MSVNNDELKIIFTGFKENIKELKDQFKEYHFDISIIFLPQYGHVTFEMFLAKVIDMSQFAQTHVGISNML